MRCTGADLKPKYYGYLVSDIPALIEDQCLVQCDEMAAVDTSRRYQLYARFRYIIYTLSPLGYDLNIHPKFGASLVSCNCA